MKTISNPSLEKAILAKNNKEVNDVVCKERLIINSVVYNGGKSVILTESLRNAKALARQLCRETKGNVVINHHQPWDSWREYISVFYNQPKLRWHYLHVDALNAITK